MPEHIDHARYLATRRTDALDGLRAFAIAIVVWHHVGAHEGRPLGVTLFFAISGFVITTMLLRERTRTGTVSLRNFYVRRTLRIFPLYYAVLGLYVVLVALLERGTRAAALFAANLPAYATFTSNWFATYEPGVRAIFLFAWSLALQEQFYLFWPIVIRRARGWHAPVALMTVLLVVGEASRWAVASAHLDRTVVARILTSFAAPICLGSLTAYLLHEPRGFRLARAALAHRWSAPVAIAIIAGAVFVEEIPMLAMAGAAVVLVAACVLGSAPALLRRVLENRAARFLGTISFGIYLLHMLVINGVRQALGTTQPVLVFAVAFPLTVLVAAASYFWFEQRVARLREWFLVRRPVFAESAGTRAGAVLRDSENDVRRSGVT